MIELLSMIEAASAWAEHQFELNGEVAATWLAEKADGVKMILEAPFSENKDTAAALIRGIFAHEHVIRCVLVGEAWEAVQIHSAVSKAEIEAIAKKGISRHPDRIEAVMFTGEDAETGMLLGRRIIQRPAIGPAQLGKLEVVRFNEGSGRFIGMLSVRGRAQ